MRHVDPRGHSSSIYPLEAARVDACAHVHFGRERITLDKQASPH